MVSCKKMKATKRMPASAITSLSYDVLVEIMASAASSSLINVANLKLVEFREAAGDDRIFQLVSLDGLPTVMWNPYSKAAEFVKHCESKGNPDAVYRRGMIEYFSGPEPELGYELLAKAAKLGHQEATYTVGIILFSHESSQNEGMELLNGVKSRGFGIYKCRRRSKEVLRELWINNLIVRRGSQCTLRTCANGGLRWATRRGEWPCDPYEMYAEESFCSGACMWTYEVNLFVDKLHGV